MRAGKRLALDDTAKRGREVDDFAYNGGWEFSPAARFCSRSLSTSPAMAPGTLLRSARAYESSGKSSSRYSPAGRSAASASAFSRWRNCHAADLSRNGLRRLVEFETAHALKRRKTPLEERKDRQRGLAVRV